jgi:hypothetical protein
LILGYIQLLETSIKIIENINKESSFGVKSIYIYIYNHFFGWHVEKEDHFMTHAKTNQTPINIIFFSLSNNLIVKCVEQ